MKKIIEILTENDEEGKTRKLVGMFEGSIEQVSEYLAQNKIEPYYSFWARKVDLIDVRDIKLMTCSCNMDIYGKLKITTWEEKQMLFEKVRKRSIALGKLTEEEKEILGL